MEAEKTVKVEVNSSRLSQVRSDSQQTIRTEDVRFKDDYEYMSHAMCKQHLDEVFGVGAVCSQILDGPKIISDEPYDAAEDKGRVVITVCTMRLWVPSLTGHGFDVTDVGSHSLQNSKTKKLDLGMGFKSARSLAYTRCAANLGTYFGGQFYDDPWFEDFPPDIERKICKFGIPQVERRFPEKRPPNRKDIADLRSVIKDASNEVSGAVVMEYLAVLGILVRDADGKADWDASRIDRPTSEGLAYYATRIVTDCIEWHNSLEPESADTQEAGPEPDIDHERKRFFAQLKEFGIPWDDSAESLAFKEYLFGIGALTVKKKDGTSSLSLSVTTGRGMKQLADAINGHATEYIKQREEGTA